LARQGLFFEKINNILNPKRKQPFQQFLDQRSTFENLPKPYLQIFKWNNIFS